MTFFKSLVWFSLATISLFLRFIYRFDHANDLKHFCSTFLTQVVSEARERGCGDARDSRWPSRWCRLFWLSRTWKRAENIVTGFTTRRAPGETASSARSATTARGPSSAAGNATSATAVPARKPGWTRAHVITISRHKTPTPETRTTKIQARVRRET